ncbi:methyltransferase [Salinarchaeum sp. IM2453]|uniref:methyltransferase n=1 Tax=Salinarchaeum sp. IM2453 TaxID=2862870 RepID=UPI001C82AFA5|nr:methyltransferase [Salinarchaeum sp. IM2453]QZA87750.1 methyltransferase [Salinarchaeum sp. IM2453]
MSAVQKTVAKLEKSCTELPAVFSVYMHSYRPVVSQEVSLGALDEADNILNVGCGAMPFTAGLLAKYTDATIHAIDKDSAVLTEAQQNLNRVGVGDNVKLYEGDGTKVVGDGSIVSEVCDVAVLALQARPKDQIVSAYQSTSDAPSKVIVRQPRSIFEETYDSISTTEATVDSVTHLMPTFDQSLMLQV